MFLLQRAYNIGNDPDHMDPPVLSRLPVVCALMIRIR